MVTALQIALLLILIALIGIILGYLFGRLACKKREDSLYFEKSDYCEEQYTQNLLKDDVSGSANSDFNSDLTSRVIGDSNKETLGSASHVANSGAQSLAGSSKIATEGGEDIATQTLKKDQDRQENSLATENGSSDASNQESLAKESEEAQTSDKQNTLESQDAKADSESEKTVEGEAAKEDSGSQKSDLAAASSSQESTTPSSDTSNQESLAAATNEEAQTSDKQNTLESQDTQADSESEKTTEDEAAKEDSEKSKDKVANESSESTTSGNSNEAQESSKDQSNVSTDDVGVKPPLLTEPKNGKKDNLCRIKGIGNIIEGKLNDLGIFHFEQIAAWSEEEVKWIDTHLAFSGRILREDWIGQAKLLAKGEETEFSKRVDKGEVATSKIN